MKHFLLKDYFKKINFDWELHKNEINTINKLTKTKQITNNKNIEIPGMEQTYLLFSINKYYNCKNFFEIGTGRGTTSYAVSLLPSIEKIITLDIIPFEKNLNTIVNFEKKTISLKGIYDLIPYKEKEKIKFYTKNSYDFDKTNYKNKFDIAFIDGCHDNVNTIINDFELCQNIIKDNGVIIFDDYLNIKEPTEAVDKIIKMYPNYNYSRISFHGQLFEGKIRNKDHNIVIVEKL